MTTPAYKPPYNPGFTPQVSPDFTQPPNPFNPSPYQYRSTGAPTFRRSPVNPDYAPRPTGPVQASPADAQWAAWKANKSGLLGNTATQPAAPAVSGLNPQPSPYNPAAVPPNMYQNLNANSGAGDIAAAYAQWSGANGGNTQANQQTAMGFLQNLGIQQPMINQAYQTYQNQYSPFGQFGNQMSNWAHQFKPYGGGSMYGGNN